MKNLAQLVKELELTAIEKSWLGSREPEVHDSIKEDYKVARKAVSTAIQEADRIKAALKLLCQELTCPAMEYLNEGIQKAWSNACNLLKDDI